MLIDINRQSTKKTEKGIKESQTLKFLKKRMLQIKHISDLLETIPEKEEIVIIQTENAFSAFDYVLYMIKKFGTIDQLILSTFNMGEKVANSFVHQIKEGNIKEADILVNNKFKEAESDRKKFEDIISIGKQNGKIKLHFDQNHTKNILIRIGENHFVWFGSGNSSSNSEMEDYIWFIDKEVFDYKKRFLLKSLGNE